MYQKAAELIKHHEGFSHKPYRDTMGKLTIGYGRNLDDKGISREEAGILLNYDLVECATDLRALFENFDELSETRQAVLMDMRYNLGPKGFRSFEKMIAAVRKGEYERAAAEMMDSKWEAQVPGRVWTLAVMMEEDEDVVAQGL
jgi:lysozyme